MINYPRKVHSSILLAAAAIAIPALSCIAATPDPAYDAFEQGNYLTAIKEAEKAAARGGPAAHTLLGEISSKGLGVARDAIGRSHV